MKRICSITVLAVIIAAFPALFDGSLIAAPMGTALTYQGQLQQFSSGGGIGQQPSFGPVTGVCDFRFSLWDAVTNGNRLGTIQTNSAVSVSNGLFTVTLDFGTNAFNGDARWLEIGVRTNGVGAFTELSPRQLVPLVPYALYAAEAGSVAATNFIGIVPDAQLSTNVALLNSSANFIDAVTALSFAGNGGGLTNLNAANLTGILPLSNLNPAVVTNYNAGQVTFRNNLDLTNGGAYLIDGNLALFVVPTVDPTRASYYGGGAGNTNSTGNTSAGFGLGALGSAMTGGANTAFGFNAGLNITNGEGNTLYGYIAGLYTTSGHQNVGIGSQALRDNTSGSYNVSAGDQSMFANTIGSLNTVAGQSALWSNTTGSNNVALGALALLYITNGQFNIGIGRDAGTNLPNNATNVIIIGNVGTPLDTNIIRIGDVQTDTYIAGVIHGNGSGLTNYQGTNLANGGSSAGQVLTATSLGVTWSNAPTSGGGGIATLNGTGTNLTVYGTLTSTNLLGTITNIAQSFSGSATNAINNNNGVGTNLTVYGTLTSTNLNSLYDTNGAAQSATNNFGRTVAVTLTNAANQFAGTFTNGTYYGNGLGLTNLNAANLIGTLTNNTTGNASYATNAGNATTAGTATNAAGSVIVTNNEANVILGGTFTNGTYYGNGLGLTNLNAANLIGTLTNNTTGNASYATNAGNATTATYATTAGTATNSPLGAFGSAATNSASAFQPASAGLTNLSTGNGGTMTNLTIWDTLGGSTYTTYGTNGIIRTNTSTGNNFQQVSSSLTFGNSNNVVQSQFGNTSTGAVINVIANGATNTWNFNTNGQLAGNGGGLTNVNAATATIASNLASSATLTSSQIASAGGLTNNETGVTLGGTFTGTYTGNGGGLTNLEANGLTNFGLSHILFVDLNGHDATAVRGDFTHPWLSVVPATNGDLVQFGNGSFSTTYFTNGQNTVLGLGIGATTLTNWVVKGPNTTFANLTVNQIAGVSRALSSVSPNLTLNNVSIGGMTNIDCVTDYGTNHVFNNSYFYGSWDIDIYSSGFAVWNNDQIVESDAFAPSTSAGMHALSIFADNSTLILNGGVVTMSSTQPTSYYGSSPNNYFIGLAINNFTNVTIRIYGTVFNHSANSNSPPIYPFFNLNSALTNIFGWYWDNGVLTFVNGTNIYQPYNLGTFTGNGSGLTNLQSSSVVGTLTNNTTGNTSYATNAGTATTATTATTASSFSGSLSGDVTGTQGATVVSAVGGQTAANVATATTAANAATSANTASTIVARDASGNFSAGSITLNSVLNLPATTASAGIIELNGNPILQAYGIGNFFAGSSAGNFTMTGTYNTAIGGNALNNNMSGIVNVALGYGALYANTNGSYNMANGYRALYVNTSGSYNTANGAVTLYSNSTGSNNIALGYQAGYNQTTGSSNIYIGNLGVAGENNRIYIGTAGVQTNTVIAGVITGNGGGLTNVNATTAALATNVVSGIAITNGTYTGTFAFTSNGVPTITAGPQTSYAYLIYTNSYGSIPCNNHDFTVEFVGGASISVWTNLFTVTYSTPLSGSIGVIPLWNYVTAAYQGYSYLGISVCHVDYTTVSTNGFTFLAGATSSGLNNYTNDFHFVILGQ